MVFYWCLPTVEDILSKKIFVVRLPFFLVHWPKEIEFSWNSFCADSGSGLEVSTAPC